MSSLICGHHEKNDKISCFEKCQLYTSGKNVLEFSAWKNTQKDIEWNIAVYRENMVIV